MAMSRLAAAQKTRLPAEQVEAARQKRIKSGNKPGVRGTPMYSVFADNVQRAAFIPNRKTGRPAIKQTMPVISGLSSY
jgi:hypothetical protein